MKRALTLSALLAMSALLPGCPVYPSEGCVDSRDCAPGYGCDSRTAQCVGVDDTPDVSAPSAGRCSAPGDCRQNETCGKDGYCLPGDCTQWGCSSGYVCDVSSGYAKCAKSVGAGGSSGKAGAAGASAGAAGATPLGGAGGATAGGAAGAASGAAGAAAAGAAGAAGASAGAGGAGAGGTAAGAGGSAAGAGGSTAGAGGSAAGAGGSTAGAGGSPAGAGGSTAGAGGSSAGTGGSTAGTGGSSAGTGGFGGSAGAGGATGSDCDAGGLPAATGTMQLVDGSTWSACAGGLSSDPAETKLSLVGGKGAPNESWTLTVVGQNASSAVVTCNANGVVCAFSSSRVQGTSTTKYASTAKPFDVKVSVWTAGSFIGTAENVQMARTISVPGQVDQQVVDGVTVVLVSTKK